MMIAEPIGGDALTPARPAGATGRAADAWPRHRAKSRQRRRRNARSARKNTNAQGRKP